MRVERVAHGVGVPVLGEVDMRHLGARVHAGIGAAGALHQRALAGKGRHRRGEHTLHGRLLAAWICQPAKGAPSYSMVSL